MKLIGIGGTNGSGKDTLSQILADDYGWLFISSSRDLLIPELKRRGLPLEREHMSAVNIQWNREDKDPTSSPIVQKALEKYEQMSQNHKYNGLVQSSIRHQREADKIHQLGGIIVWVDADPKVRYERVVGRSHDAKDRKTFEQFLAEEKAEMTHSGDNATLNMAGVKDRADIILYNNSNDPADFKAAAQKALAEILG